MILVWSALAAPPDGVDPDDVARWEAMTDATLAGPAGCWELAGDVSVQAALLSKASIWRPTTETPYAFRGTWRGTLDDGVWTSFRYALEDVVKVDGEPLVVPIYPVVGEIDPATATTETEPSPDGSGPSITVNSDGDSPASLLRASIEAWDTRSATAFGVWREGDRHVELVQDTPVKDHPNAPTITMTTRIPEGEWVSRVSAVFPRKLTLGQWPVRVRLHDTQFHLVQRRVPTGEGVRVLPAAETASSVGTALGFTLSYEQRLDYRKARPCPE